MSDDLFGDVIYAYTRAQALEDGVLVDAGEAAKEAGFKWPVALTQAAWAQAVTVPAGCEGFQTEAGRLWDVLNLARWAAKLGTLSGEDRVRFDVLRVVRPEESAMLALDLHVGPGDEGEPVLTIMLPGED